MTRAKRFLPVVAAALMLACATTNTPRSDSRAEIIHYVQRAADVVRAHGANACGELQRPEWFANGWYVFVLDSDGRTVCHPARPENVGRPAHDLVDVNGKRFGDEFLQAARNGGGWVDYSWPRANGSEPEPKSSYVMPVTGADGATYIVGSGGHSTR